MKTFCDECAWIFLAAYMFLFLFAGTALGSGLNSPSLDTVKVSPEKLHLLTSRDYPIYSVLINKSLQTTVRIMPSQSSAGCLRQLAKDVSELSLSDWHMSEDVVRLPAPVSLPQRKVNHYPIPFNILKVHF